jgi:hypothetical protein
MTRRISNGCGELAKDVGSAGVDRPFAFGNGRCALRLHQSQNAATMREPFRGSPVGKTLRRIPKLIAWLSALTAAVTFVGGTFITDNSPILKPIWQISALSGLLAFIIETYLRKVDARNANAISKQLNDAEARAITADKNAADAIQRADTATKRAETLNYRLSGREISAEGRKAMIDALGKFAGQKFQIFSMDSDNIETEHYAQSLCRTLVNCGWIRESAFLKPQLNQSFSGNNIYGLALIKNPSDSLQKGQPPPITEKILRNLCPILIENYDVPPGGLVFLIPPKPLQETEAHEQMERHRRLSERWPIDQLLIKTEPLAKFAGQDFSIFCPIGDEAAEYLCMQLAIVIERAGWRRQGERVQRADYPLNFKNVAVMFSKGDGPPSSTHMAAVLLCTCLANLGLISATEAFARHLQPVEIPKGPILIWIGLNPDPIAGS